MDCIFCKIAVMVIMDANPSVDGHALIIPKKHYTDYQELDQEVLTHIFEVAKKIGPKIMQKLNAESLTLLINYGEDQKVKHFHMHLLPNFGTRDSMATKPNDEIYSILKD